MVKPKVACYITGGWTECGYMTAFLNKINNTLDYRQRFPQKNIGKKGKSRAQFKVDGQTGAELIRWIYNDMKGHKRELQGYCAVLIEDDMDQQYFLPSKERRDYEKIQAKNMEIAAEIRKILEDEKIQVFFLYALPEIEAWFIADWDHTFAKEYQSILQEMNAYFQTTFRKYIAKQVLTKRFPVKEIENFGYIDLKYQKLSDRLKLAFQEYSCCKEINKNNADYNAKINALIQINKVMYSKKREGINMLQRLEPDNVADICTYYFAKSCQVLREFQG